MTGAAFFWGNDNINAAADVRFLSPGYDSSAVAQTTSIYLRAPSSGTLSNLFMRHNTPGGNGNSITYAVQVNGVDTALAVTMASTASNGSNLINSVPVAQGDLVGISITKPLTIASGTLSVTATLNYVTP